MKETGKGGVSKAEAVIGCVLLIDPSEKGAMPLYTAMVANSLQMVGIRACVLANTRVVEPDLPRIWTLFPWLPAGRWPRARLPGPLAKAREAVAWLGCAVAVILTASIVRPSIIHFQYPLHLRLDRLLIRGLRRWAPVVWTAHDVTPHDPGLKSAEQAAQTYRAADLVLVHSRPAAADVQRLAGVDAQIVPHPVRPLDEIPSRAAARARLQLDPSVRIAVAVGFIRAYKGYGLLAETWAHLGDAAPLLLILGELVDESEREAVQALTNHPRTDIRLGYASDADVVTALAAADVVLLPHARGSDSGVLHMARAVGTPVISSDTPQLAAVVQSTQSGVVVPRSAQDWARAVVGILPPPPPAPVTPKETGERHRSLYARAISSWRDQTVDANPPQAAPIVEG
jgi:glycosyltransferase involved in cell wall biosynthesis